MKKLLPSFWFILRTIFASYGLLNGFFSYEQISKEIKCSTKESKLSEIRLTSYMYTMHVMVNFFYFLIVIASSISEIFLELIIESIFKDILKPINNKKQYLKNKLLNIKNYFSKWYSPKYEGSTLKLINSNNYIFSYN